MLAYVFWHWPAADVAPDAYERLQVNFHAALAQANIAGFQGSMSFKIDGDAPWLGGAPAYADWYLVDTSAVLDPLNAAAVSSARRGPHDVLAHAMGAGAGSLLQLQSAAAALREARVATWFAKPKGMPYDPFYQRLTPLTTDQQVSLWRRQMVLGPTPEFGMLSPAPVQLPAGLDAHVLHFTPVSG